MASSADYLCAASDIQAQAEPGNGLKKLRDFAVVLRSGKRVLERLLQFVAEVLRIRRNGALREPSELVNLGTREVVCVAVKRSPTNTWTAQQLRNAPPFGEGPRFIIRDRDNKFGPDFDRAAKGAGIRVIKTAVRAPNVAPIAGLPILGVSIMTIAARHRAARQSSQ